MKIEVHRVSIPPMSTVGFGYGRTEDGRKVSFIGDHRPMRHIGEAIAGWQEGEDRIEVEIEDWQVSNIEEQEGTST